jgi:hypothetical protein
MASQADTHATHYHRRARRRCRQVPTEERGGGAQPRPQNLPGCTAKPPASSPAQIRATREEQGGRWVGGNCRGPMASQAESRVLPHYLRELDPPMSTVMPPPFTCTSTTPEVHRPLQHRLPPAATPPDLLMAVVDSSPAPWTSPSSERRGGRGGGLPRPHSLPGCHPHPATSTPPPSS